MTKYRPDRRIDRDRYGGTGISSGATGSPAPPPVDTSSAIASTTYPYDPAGSGDSVMLTCFDESGYSPTVWTDNASSTFNAKVDELVLGITPATADLVYVVETELARMPSVRTLVMWTNYFTIIGGTGVDFTKCRPAIGHSFKARLSSLSQWNVDTYTASTALQLPTTPAISGTSDDVAFVAGARFLASRGYNIGVAPIVRFLDLNATQESTWELWRGQMDWGVSLSTLTSWLVEYQTFVLHYINLLLAGGITPSIFYVGSEFRDLSTKAPASYQAAWITQLQSLADQIKALSPTTIVTYASNYDEYAYTNPSGFPNSGNFALDGLWSYPTIDRVGVDWYQPLALNHTNDPNKLRAGVLSGENFDSFASGYDDNETHLISSHGAGLTLAPIYPQTTMDSAYGSKPIAFFIQSAHYVTKPGGVNAGSSPLAGDWRGSTTILSDMSGPATTTKLSTIPVAADGMRAPPHQRDCWLALNGTSSYGSLMFPTYSTAPTSYTVEVDFKYSGGSSTFSRVLRSLALDVFIDTTGTPTLKVGITRSGGTDYSAGYTVVSGIEYVLKVLVENLQYTISINGTPVEVGALGGAATMPASAGTWYLGSYTGTSDFLSGRLYYLRIQGDKAGIKSYGGIYYFEESYAGIRTAWVPNSKSAMATEIGFASMQGSVTRPNTFPSVITAGSGSLPATYGNKAYWDQFVSEGLRIVDMIGPYGSTFLVDELHQAICLDVTIKALRQQGIVAFTVYNVDTRPRAVWLATYVVSGVDTLYYIDGPKGAYAHAINSKKIGGF